MSETYPFEVPAGNNIVPATSGLQALGSVAKPFSGLYTNQIYRSGVEINNIYQPSGNYVVYELPTYASVAGYGNPTYTIGTSGTATNYTILSGNSFTVMSGNNFIIQTGNPHMITYTGPNMMAKIDIQVSSLNLATEVRISPIKNGYTVKSGISDYSTNRAGTAGGGGGYSWIHPVVSGDYFQVGGWSTGGINTNSQLNTFQMVITKLN